MTHPTTPQDYPLYSSANKKVLGKLKDVCAGRAIAEYVGLRPKMLSILEAGEKNTKKAKGVKKNVVKKYIRHEQYKEALFKKQTFLHSELRKQRATASPTLWTVHQRIVATPGHTGAQRGVQPASG